MNHHGSHLVALLSNIRTGGAISCATAQTIRGIVSSTIEDKV
jgi:hypothetical protein